MRSAPSTGEGFFAGWNTSRLSGYRGCCALLLGGRDAIVILEEAAALTSPGMVSQRCAVMIDLATAYARAGQIDAACALLSETLNLASRAHLPEIVRRIVSVWRYDLSPMRAHADVKRLDDQLRSIALGL